jgi:membrane-anchored protein YejM (alkaline phosphatase superfamily)
MFVAMLVQPQVRASAVLFLIAFIETHALWAWSEINGFAG